MARTLPAAITNALAASGAQHSLSVQIQNLTTQFTPHTTGGPLSGRVHALLTGANTLLRVVVTQNPEPNTISIQRITAPYGTAQWNSAATAVTANARGSAGCALAQTGATIRLFYYTHAADTVVYRDSTDDGVTWSAEQPMPASPWPLPNACYGLMAPDISMVTVASAAFPGFDLAAALMYRSIFSGGWGAWTLGGPATPTWGQLRGLCAYKHTNGFTYVAGGVQLRTLRTGCAAGVFIEQYPSVPANYGQWFSVAAMDNKNLGLSYAYPHLSFDPATGNFYIAAMLQDDGTVSGTAQTRLGLFLATDGVTYSLLGWIGNTLSTNACTVTIAGVVYVFDAASSYVMGQVGGQIDVTNDVLALRITERPGAPQAATLVLANDAGQYTALSNLAPNATCWIALGYNNVWVPTHRIYLDSIALVASAENLTCEITGRSLSKFLQQVISRALIYSNQTVAQLITAIMQHTQLTLDALPATAQFGMAVPCYMLQPGDTWATALNRLANVYGYTSLDRSTPSVKIVEPQGADASTWTYGQETLGLAWAQHADQATYIRVIGQSASTTPVYTDLTDDTAILLSGGERYRHIVDRNLTGAAQTKLRAQLALREEQRQAATGTLTVALNPTHELMDVVTITDTRVGLAAQRARIVGIDTHITMQSGEWLQHLHVQLP